MERNLDWRVEVAFPIYDPKLLQEVSDMMALQVGDCYKARVLDQTQSNLYVIDGTGKLQAQRATQEYFHDISVPTVHTPESVPGG
jgi:polyphosphate kinase